MDDLSVMSDMFHNQGKRILEKDAVIAALRAEVAVLEADLEDIYVEREELTLLLKLETIRANVAERRAITAHN